MLNEKIYKALSSQVQMEWQSSAAYLAMATWCDKEGMNGCADFFYAQSDEERVHMLKILHYISEMDEHAIVPAVTQPQSDFDSIQVLFKQVYEMERGVTNSIHGLLSLCQQEGDHATMNFLQWYVTEQREEEAMMRNILDRIRLIGEGGQSLYYIDKEVEKINIARAAAAKAGGADAADTPTA